MTPNREELLFQLALSKPASKRVAWLDLECDGDAALRQRIDALLAAHDATGVIPAGDSVEEQLAATIELAEPLADEAVGQTLGRYKLLERVGEGGCGVVYVAEQTEPVRRRVALKVIKLGMDTKQVVARFEAERQALAMMDHPNIAKVLDAGTTEVGRPYFVMELVRGIRITDYCDQGNLSTKDRLDLFIKVCQAIQHAHQKGIIHRDIKPSNILVTLHDGVPVPKVIDFGIAKAIEGRLTDATVYTQLHQFIGTPAYMSPEQAEMSGLDIDTRSDIYSLGVLLYELLAGSTPFDGKELMSGGIDAMRKTIREKEPQRPSTRLATLGGDELTTKAKRRSADTTKLLHQLKGDLDWIVMKCLEKDRQRRYDTANALAADLKRHLENEPVIARPPSTAYRFQKAFRRNKLVFAAGSTVVIALVAGLCLAALGWRQARGERDKALRARAGEEAQRKMAVEASERARAGELEARRLAALARRTAYVADMALAHQAAAQGNVARAKDLLQRYRPKNGEEDLRGFEWRYIWTQTRSDETARVGEYSGFHGGIALSPDGVYLASVTDRGVEIRSFKNRALILVLTNAGGAPIQFSPDSQRLVTTRGVTTRDCSLVIWNTRSWQQEGIFPGATYPFAFARHGEVIVAGQDDHLSLWSVQDLRKIADLPGAKVFSTTTTFRTLAVSSDGHRVFLGYTNRIRAWDLRSQTELDPLFSPMVRSSTSIAVSPEGLLVAAHWNGNVTLWDTETRQNLHTFGNHLGAAHCAAISPDGAYLATAGTDQTILLYEARSRKLLRRFKGHEGAVFALQFSSDGRWLVSGSTDDGSLRLWDVASPSQEEGVEMKASLGRLALRFIDSNRSVVGWSSNGYTRIDVKTGTATPMPIGSVAAVNSNNIPFRLASVSPDGNRAALRSGDNRSLSIWNLPAGTEQLVLLTNTPGQIWRPEFSADGKYLAVPVDGWKTRIWNTTDWSSLSLEDSASSNVWRLVFSLNATRLLKAVAPGQEGQGEVLDLASGKILHRVTEERALGLALSPDGTLLAVGTQDGLVQLWNVDRGQKIGTLRGHVQFVMGVAFSPDGRTLASGAGNQVKLWNVESQQEILAITASENPTTEFTFSSDGLCLATRSNADRLFFWRAPSFEEIAATEARAPAPPGSARDGTTEGKQP